MSKIGSVVVMAPEVQVNGPITSGTAYDVVASCSLWLRRQLGLFSLMPPVPVKHITVKQVNQPRMRQCNRITNNKKLETALMSK